MNKTLQEQLQEVKKTMVGEIKENKYVGEHIENIAKDEFGNILDLKDIKRGDVLFTGLTGGLFSEQNNDRYCVCIQNDIGNRYSPTIIVAFFTSQMTKAKLPVHLEISAGQFGLPKDSVLMLEQVRTIDKRRIKSRVGKLDQETIKKLDNAIDVSMKELHAKSLLEKLPLDMREYVTSTLKQIKKLEITTEEMKNEEIDKSAISVIVSKKLNILNQFIKYCSQHQLDYKEFYVVNKGVNPEITL